MRLNQLKAPLAIAMWDFSWLERRWPAMAASNFCGPQFAGMWRDIEWRREMTRIIKSSDGHRGLTKEGYR